MPQRRQTRPRRGPSFNDLKSSFKVKKNDKISKKPEFQLAPASHSAIVTWNTPKQDYIASLTNTDQIVGGEANYLGDDPESGIIITDMKEFDGDESHLLIQALPNDRETYIQSLELEPRTKLEKLYKELAGNEPNKNWADSTLIEAIAEERYNK